jgi:hypothetical protein
MKKAAVDISDVFVDARDGNNSRPYCIIVKTPNKAGPNAWPKFDQVWRVRAATPEIAEELRLHLIAKRKSTKALAVFIEHVEHLQFTGRLEAQERSALAYQKRQAAERSERDIARLTNSETFAER